MRKKVLVHIIGILFLFVSYVGTTTVKSLAQTATTNSTYSIGKGSGSSCNMPIAFTIYENSTTDFTDGTSVSYAIQLPAGFSFDPDVTGVGYSYSLIGGATIATVSITSLKVTGTNNDVFIFTYTMTGSSTDKGSFNISNINVICNIAGSYGTIYRVDATKSSFGTNAGSANAVINLDPLYNGTNASSSLSHGFLDSRAKAATSNLSGYEYAFAQAPNGQYSYFAASLNLPTPLIPGSPRISYCLTPVANAYYYYYGPYTSFSFTFPAVTGESYTLWDGAVQKASSYNYGSPTTYMNYTPTSLDVGDKSYTIHKTNSLGCNFQSEQILLHLDPAPVKSDYDSYADTSFQQTDDPVALNSYITQASPNYDLLGIAGNGINGINSNYTFLFLPGVVKSGSVYPQYLLQDKTTGCQALYNFPKPLIVSDPLAALPNYIHASSYPPYCANGKNFKINFRSASPSDSIIYYYYLRLNGRTIYANTYPSEAPYSPDIIIDPIKDNPGTNLLYYSVIFHDLTTLINHSYSGYITLFPERNPQLVGLPEKNATDSIVSLCASSKDTIFMRPNPANGSLSISRYNPATNTYKPFAKAINFFPWIGPGESSTSRYFFAQQLFEDTAACNKNYGVKFKITYIYPGTTLGQCPDTITRIITFAPAVGVTESIIKPTLRPICFGTEIIADITHDVSIPHRPKDRYYWNFGDGISLESDSLLFTKHTYTRPGRYIFRFKTLLDSIPAGKCNNDVLDTIYVGAQPKADFDVYRNFQNQWSTFKNLSTLTPPNLTQILPDRPKLDTLGSWIWRFGDTTPADTLYTNTYIEHKYSTLQKAPYAVTLKVHSGWGCVDSVTKYIPLFPVKLPTPSVSTSYGFASTDINGWYQSGDYKNDTLSSWQNKPPAGKVIKPLSAGNAAWISSGAQLSNSIKGLDKVGYFNNEKSYVESPVFNLDSLSLPLLSLKTWSNTDNLFDGAVLQFAICDSVAFGKEKWNTLGTNGLGVDWYNSVVVSKPGGSQFGWTGNTDKEWSFSAYVLSDVQDTLTKYNKKLIRFRIILGTNSDNTPNKSFDGFAFDDFFIGQRNRKVLVEEFCDYKNFEAQFNIDPYKNNPQLIRMQYHSRYMNLDDEINNQNIGETGARNLLYGYSQLPRAAVDGYYSLDTDNPFFNNAGEINFGKRLLEISPFIITINPPTVSGNALNFKVNMIRNSTVENGGPFVLQVAVLEKQVIGNGKVFTNVFRKFLPHASGEHVDKDSWPIGSTNAKVLDRSFTPFTELTPRSNPTDTSIILVAFVQDEATSEVYQSEVYYVPYSVVQGLTKVPLPKKISTSQTGITVYPNPTQNSLAVHFNAGMADENYVYHILDIYGQIIASGTINKDAQEFNVPGIQTMPVGVYQMQLLGNTTIEAKTFTIVR